MLEVGNATETILTANQTIPFSTISYDTNTDSHFDVSTNSLVIDKSGYYIVSGEFVFSPTAVGDASIYLYVNGNQIPASVTTFTATEESQKFTFVISPKVIKTIPTLANSSVPVRFVSSVAGTLYNANALLIGAR